MSSFDPDDTTPLINPQDSNPNHGTFNEGEDDEPLEQGAEQNASDDEMLDGQQPSNTRRFNPFDRVPNLPPQLREELGTVSVVIPEAENESAWGRFKTGIKR